MITLDQVVDRLCADEELPITPLGLESVVVTGAGGFIGSALCRRLFAQGVRKFVLVDHAEHSLYMVNRELVGLGASTRPLLCSYGDTPSMTKAFAEYRPQWLYHVGAYKHVPLVEENVIGGVRNNVFEVRPMLSLCCWESIPVTMVSTDKAVRPSSAMGATKAIVEHLVLSYSWSNRVVRFGNVLGSTGSVVPLFYRQALNGQPMTITDLKATRYFMNVRQAVSLIADCGALEGRRFLLDMGEPRSIFSMAEQIAQLMNVPFKYEVIGLREGEKLHESLSLVPWKPTGNPLIYSVDDPRWSAVEVEQAMRNLMIAAASGDPGQMFQCLESLGIQYRRTRNFDRNAIVGVFPDRSGPFDDCFTPG